MEILLKNLVFLFLFIGMSGSIIFLVLFFILGIKSIVCELRGGK